MQSVKYRLSLEQSSTSGHAAVVRVSPLRETRGVHDTEDDAGGNGGSGGGGDGLGGDGGG